MLCQCRLATIHQNNPMVKSIHWGLSCSIRLISHCLLHFLMRISLLNIRVNFIINQTMHMVYFCTSRVRASFNFFLKLAHYHEDFFGVRLSSWLDQKKNMNNTAFKVTPLILEQCNIKRLQKNHIAPSCRRSKV